MNITRRDFLKGTGVAAAALAGGAAFAGCASDGGSASAASSSAAEEAAASSAGAASASAAAEAAPAAASGATKLIEFNGQTLPVSMAKPEPISEADISEVRDCDVLIIGAGISGCPAAAIASEKGANVIVVEKSGSICVTRPTGLSWFGTKKLKELGVLCTEEEKATIVKDIFGGANATS